MGDVIIGLEIHVQLNRLQSKMFCGCSTALSQLRAQQHTCPVCLGLPALCRAHKKAVEYGIKVGLALNCKNRGGDALLPQNYYYPDLPKGSDQPVYFPGHFRHIMIRRRWGGEEYSHHRAHMEEDPGRLVHAGTIDKAKYTWWTTTAAAMPC